ncbi:hypothetical protein PTKIN_Ptkin15bG0052600 [Pterospermum kingtungense]
MDEVFIGVGGVALSFGSKVVDRYDIDICDIEDFGSFAWGRRCFNLTMSGLKGKLCITKSSSGYYSIASFPLGFQIWFYECDVNAASYKELNDDSYETVGDDDEDIEVDFDDDGKDDDDNNDFKKDDGDGEGSLIGSNKNDDGSGGCKAVGILDKGVDGGNSSRGHVGGHKMLIEESVLSDPFEIVMVEDLPSQLDNDCAIFVTAFVEYFICGLDLLSTIDVDVFRKRYLLHFFGMGC